MTVVLLSCLAAPSFAADDVARLVELMAKVGFATSPSFSPDGKTLAFVSNVSGLPQVWTVPVAGGYPELVTAFDDPVGAVRWSPDGAMARVLARPRRRDERTGLRGQARRDRRADVDRRRQVEPLHGRLEPRRQVDHPLLEPPHPGGDGRLLRGCGRQTPAGGGEPRRREPSPTPAATAVSPSSRAWSAAASNDLYLVSTDTGKEILLTPHEGPGQFFGVLTPDGATVYLGTNKTTDNLALGRVKVAAGAASGIEVLLARDDAELDDITIDDEGRQLALTWNVGGRSELSLYDVATGKERRLGNLPERDRRPAPPSHRTDGRWRWWPRARARPPTSGSSTSPAGSSGSSRAAPTPASTSPPSSAPSSSATPPTTGFPSPAGCTAPRDRPAPARSSWTITAGRRGRRARRSTARTRRFCSAASPCSRPTCAAPRASARSS